MLHGTAENAEGVECAALARERQRAEARFVKAVAARAVVAGRVCRDVAGDGGVESRRIKKERAAGALAQGDAGRNSQVRAFHDERALADVVNTGPGNAVCPADKKRAACLNNRVRLVQKNSGWKRRRAAANIVIDGHRERCGCGEQTDCKQTKSFSAVPGGEAIFGVWQVGSRVHN